MGMVVRTNTMALNAYRQLGMNNSAVAKSLEKLSSGFRINRAGDDAAGLAISEKMKAQIKGLETASANAQDGISLIQTAEGNLNEVHDMLNRMVELATKSANGTYTSTERKALQDEVDQLLDEVDRISKSANFNGTKLLNGTMGLNTEAFDLSGTKAATKATDGTVDITDKLSGAASPDFHKEEASAAQQVAKFTVDLTGAKITNVAGAATTKKTTVTLTGNTTLFGTNGVKTEIPNVANTTVKTANDIATALVGDTTNFLNYAKSGPGTNDSFVVTGTEGNYVFSATVSGDGIEFELIGMSASGKTGANDFTAIANHKLTDDQAKELNDLMGSAYTVELENDETDATKTPQLENVIIHNTTNVQEAVAKQEASFAGIDLTLDDTIVKEGNILTIDGKSYIFKVDKDSEISEAHGASHTNADGSTATVIDLTSTNTSIKLTDNYTKIHAAADLLSKQTIIGQSINKSDTLENNGREWTISVKNGTTIHIDQTKASGDGATANNFGTGVLDPLDSREKIEKLFTLKDPSQESSAKLAGNVIEVKDYARINVGDKIKIGEDEYTFVANTDTVKPGEKKINIGTNLDTTLDNIVTALGTTVASKEKVTLSDGTEGNAVVVRGTTNDNAPEVASTGLTLQIGDTADEFNKMSVTVKDMSANGLGLEALKKKGIMTEASASNAIDMIKEAINTVSSTRAGMGALQNRLEHTINNLDVAAENLSAANSRIRDTDMAKEMMNYTKMNVLVQSAQAMLAQANQQPQSVLQLLQ